MATPKGGGSVVALAHTSALPYSSGGSISVVEVSPILRPRTDGARCAPAPATCCLLPDSKNPTASGSPSYDSQRAMRAATAQQGYDNIYMLEMLEDDAVEALAAEIKQFAVEWVRGGIAWWTKGGGGGGGKVDPDSIDEGRRRIVLAAGGGGPPSAGLMAEIVGKPAPAPVPSPQKRKPSTPRGGRWTGKHIEVKRKEEEQRERARQGSRCSGTSRYSMPSLGPAISGNLPTLDAFAGPPVALQPPLKPLPALPTGAEQAPKQVQQALSFGTGRPHSAPLYLRRRRLAGGEGDSAAQVDTVSSS